jgi:hypothetical protein
MEHSVVFDLAHGPGHRLEGRSAPLLRYWTQWGATPNAFFDAAFLITVPGLVLTLAGSTVLGIALLGRQMRPRTPAWLLVMTIPLALAILQMTSMGSAALPVMFAFGILGRHIARERARAPLPGDPVRGADAVPIDEGADALPHDQGVAR